MANSNRYANILGKVKQKGREVAESELIQDKDWIDSAKTIYKMDNGKDFKGSDQEAVQFGLDRMSKFNYNATLGAIPDALTIGSKSMDEKIAFMYLMDTYEDKKPTYAGFKRAIEYGVVKEPLTLAGLFSGKIVGAAAKSATVEGIKRSLMSEIKTFMLKPAVTASAGGTAFAGGQNVAEQQVKTQAGIQKGIDKGEALQTAAIGGAVGGTLVKGAEAIGKQIGKGMEKISQQLEEPQLQGAIQ